MKRALSIVSLVVLMTSALTAPARAAPCVHIAGARVWLPGGHAEVSDVVLTGTTITAVGSSLKADGCTRVDGQGKVLTAGLIDAWSQLGLIGIEQEGSTVDVDLKSPWQDDERLVRAAARASLGYDARSIPIMVARLGGVTSALTVPRGGVIAGQGLWVDLDGDRATAIQRDAAAMVATLRPHGTAANVLDVALREASAWAKVRAEWTKMRHPGLLNRDVDLDALEPVLAGSEVLAVAVDRASDIEGLLAMTAGSAMKIVIVGGAEAWIVRDALAARAVPVVIDPLLNAPYSFDQLSAREDNATLLNAAGVPVLMSVFNTHQVRKLRQVAGNAVRAGLPWEAALLAITETPARVFGMRGHGRVAAGAIANLVLWSGDPLELSTRVEHVWIHGLDLPLTSRQTELRDRYRRL